MKPEKTKEIWQFAGANGKAPIAIEAETQAEAVEIYEQYISK